MNENQLNVPITNFACLSSLTDLLPELPLPGASSSATNPNSLILHNQRVAESASKAVQYNDPNLASSIVQALSATNVDYLELREPSKGGGIPQSPLVTSILQVNPGAFGQSFNQGLPKPGFPLQNGVASSGNEHGGVPPANTKQQIQQQQQQSNQYKMPKIDLGLSRADEALMKKKLQGLQKDAGNGGMSYNNFSPRAQRQQQKSDSKYTELDNSESDSDDDADKKKSKFFKHTEKERDTERRKRRDERKRNKDDDEYQPAEDPSDRKRKHEEDGEDDGGWLKRRRKGDEPPSPTPDLDNFVPKRVTRKIERKLMPKIQKLDPEQLMESKNYQKFNRVLESIFDNAEEVNLKELEENDDSEIPPEILIPKYQASDLSNEAAKLKGLEAMDSVPTERLVKILNILEWNVRDGSKVSPLVGMEDEDGDGDKLFEELANERVSRAADCAMCAMYIMTSKNMNKRVYIDDVIDKVCLFVRFQLQNTIYPSYDPVYREMSKHKEGYTGSMKKKRNQHHTVRDRKITNLYGKLQELVALLAELLQLQLLTDTTVLHLSTMGVAPFFVENIAELQLSSLKLVTGIFSKYEKHRKLILDDILASIARLPSTKHSLRTFRLNKNQNIQMLTALVLRLIQSVVNLPAYLGRKDKKVAKVKDEVQEVQVDPEEGMDRDVLINHKYENAIATAGQFLSVFLKKCASKSEETDFRPLFENFLQDLLVTVNTPEWPAAELLLSLLGKLLVSQFANKGTEVSLRITSLEYLGLVASRLRRDAVQSKLKLDTIDSIITSVKEAEQDAGEDREEKDEKLEEEEKRTRFLQRVLLDYLIVNGGEEDPNTQASRHFYISQWFRDANSEIRRQQGIDVPKKKIKKRERNTPQRSSRRKVESESESSEPSEGEDQDAKTSPKLAECFRLTEHRKGFLVSKILPFGDTSKGKRGHSLSSHIDETSAVLIVKYLSSKRPFFNSFDIYLKQIISVLKEQSIQVRSKALKCLASVVQEDPSVLSRDDMQKGVNYSFTDLATMVREAAVDLVGKFILHREELIDKYYVMLSERIMDTGVSVRKRVIKILKDICIEFPHYPRIPEICVKMIRRINDEEGIRKLVMEVFQNMWFVPVSDRRRTETEAQLLVTKAHNITDVVVSCRETGLEWFEQLLQTLFKPKEDKNDATKVVQEAPKQLVLACQQIVDCLMETVLKSEERSQEGGSGQSHRIVACLTTTFLFAKIRPQLLINHVQTLQPYLNIKCFTQGDYQIISNVARTLELVVPLIEHPSQIFLSQLEEASVKLILQHDKTVVAACLSCLGSVVNNVTKNYNLIRDCFRKYFGHILKFKSTHMKDPTDPRLKNAVSFFRRALFTVGMLLRYFDFSKEELYGGLEMGKETVNVVFESVYYFIDHELREVRLATLQCLGNVCIRHYDLMLGEDLKNKYIDILTCSSSNKHNKMQDTQLVLQVLNNIENYLTEEEARMIEKDKNWKEFAEKENLKEMGDVSSGMASTIIQIFLKPVLESFIHPAVQVRHQALKVIQLILNQGLVHPVQIVPYLICMSTDSEQRVSHTADRELQEIEKKYPGFIHMKLMFGIRLSYQLQEVLCKEGGVLRGFRTRENELPTALNGFLYSCLRSTKAQRRAILLNFLKQFDDTLDTSLSTRLYLADNLAYIPYTVVDEPLFLIHHIDLMVSVIGSNILQGIKESLKLPPQYEVIPNKETGKDEIVYDEDLDDDPDSVLSRLPEDLHAMQKSINNAQGCLLLLVLREHLKDFYAINEAKIQGYSPSEAQKIYERPVHRKGNAKFAPKATVEILKHPVVPADQLEEEGRRDLIQKYLGFKELMNRIEKDDDEYDDDGNLIVQGPMLNAKEIQNMGMPVHRAAHAETNGVSQPPPPTLPPGVHGKPESFNPVIRIQNIPVASLPSGSVPQSLPTPDMSGPGYLDPETGDWVSETPRKSERNSKSSVTPLKINMKDKNQESHKITPLKLNIAQPKKPSEHAFFAALDQNERERAQRRGGESRSDRTDRGGRREKPHKEKSKKKKSKKKKKYRSESEEESDSGSDSDYVD